MILGGKNTMRANRKPRLDLLTAGVGSPRSASSRVVARLLAAVVTVCIGAGMAAADDSLPFGGPIGTQWALAPAFSDEFNGSAVDANKWGVYYHQGGGSPDFPAANSQVAGGNLQLKITYDSNSPNTFKYDGGGVQSLEKSGYGYYEARIKSAAVPADNAFWLFNWKWDYDQRTNEEIDIVEQYGSHVPNGPTKAYMGYPYWIDDVGYGGGIGYDTQVNLTLDYHVYGLDWNRDNLVWYIDGIERLRIANEHWFRSEWVNLTLIPFDWLGPPEPLSAATMNVDYVRVWQAVPEPGTVALLATALSGLLVYARRKRR